MRILFLGENWYGSCARACCYALRRLGCDVVDIDVQTIFPQLRQLDSRMVLRLFRRRLVREYNELILDTAATFKPDILLAFKAASVEARSLKTLRNIGIALYNYYPDTSAFTHGTLLPEALPEYDCVFCTKRYLEHDFRSRLGVQRTLFVPHGYDPELHRLWDLDDSDLKQYRADLGIIATYTPHKEQVLKDLVAAKPHLDLRIWGNQWRDLCQSPILKKYIQGTPLNGIQYAKALRALRINLAIMSGKTQGASRGDETTTRTYEIPACGGFMLHERSNEVLGLFEEGKDIACFSSNQELIDKVDYYLAHPVDRETIATSGYSRCVPAYSYDNRMAEILKWHQECYSPQARRLPLECISAYSV